MSLNRTQRRAMERMQKKEQKQTGRHKVSLSYEELKLVTDAAREDTAEISCEMWLVAFGIYLRDCEHYGYRRMKRAFEYIDNLLTQINNGTADYQELKQRLIDEANIEIKVRDD